MRCLFSLTAIATLGLANGAEITSSLAEAGVGGGRVSGGNFSAEVETGSTISGGVSHLTSEGEQAKFGYTGQLFDIRAIDVSADPSVVRERSATQLSAKAVLDDSTLLPLSSAGISWTILDGPIASIDANGVVLADDVFLNAIASIRGTVNGITDDLDIPVINLTVETPPDTVPPPDFVAENFAPLQAGRYFGLLRDASDQVIGYVPVIQLNGVGGISGRIIFQGRSYRIRGTLEPDGTFTGEINRRNLDPLAVTLEIGRTNMGAGGLTLNATVSGDGLTASGHIDQSPYHPRNQPAPDELVRSYTFLIPAHEIGQSDLPEGDGYGTLRVLRSGAVIAVGNAGDGTRFSNRSFLTEDGRWHLYQPLYRGQGLLAGTLDFRDSPGVSDFDGELGWRKNPSPRDRRYPNGFDLPPTMVGSTFDAPARGERLLEELADQEYNARLTLAGLSIPDGGLAKTISWQTNHALVYYGPERLSARANPRNGLINGVYFDPSSRNRIRFGGAVFQKQALAGGQFLFDNLAGHLFVEPGTNYSYPGSEDAGPLDLTEAPTDAADDPVLTPVTNLDPAAAGIFQGTIASTGAGEFFGGLQNVRLSGNGVFSGLIWIEGRRYLIRGKLDESGSAQVEVSRPGLNPVVVNLQLALADGSSDGFALIGNSVFDGVPHELIAQRRPPLTRANPASESGRYTLVMKEPVTIDPALAPGGDGYGSINVIFNGNCRGLLILADGSRASLSGHLSRLGEWSVYRSLYGQRGYLAGKLTFREVSGVSDVDGECRWVKASNVPRTSNYPTGFDEARTVIGNLYQPPAPGTKAFPTLVDDFHNAWMRLQGPDLSPDVPDVITSLDRAVTWNDANRILYFGPERAIVRFNRNTGLATGRYVDRAQGINVPFGGALLQSQDLLTGSYLAGEESGRFLISPR